MFGLLYIRRRHYDVVLNVTDLFLMGIYSYRYYKHVVFLKKRIGFHKMYVA
jgi:hypothetical protein